VQQTCTHDEFHAISSFYDRQSGVLAFVLMCERCGAQLRELRREPYSPHYDPNGNDRYLAAFTGSAKSRASRAFAPGS
jgi:hypothetical protein